MEVPTMAPTKPSLLIVVPVHEDEGWTSTSPSTPKSKARLEARSPKSKSPEELKAACEKADEKATALHQ
eukprot:6068638-Prymnesium_polylepis.1